MIFPSLVNEKAKNYRVMGIINLTSDSFYSKSRQKGMEEAIREAERMVEEGADFLDVGAESSRPGAQPVSEDEELNSLLPIIPELVKRFSVPISVDTYKPGVAKRVLDLGVSMINDITGLKNHPEMAEVVARKGAGLILMHMQGTPKTMQNHPVYTDVIQDIMKFLSSSIEKAENAGVTSNNIAIDPGIGFGKTVDHNLKILKQLECFIELNKPIVLGVSRKSFIGAKWGLPVEERLEGSLAATVIGRMKGAVVFRVHDVKETVRVLDLTQDILGA